MTTMKTVVIQISQTHVVCGFNNQDLPYLVLPSQFLSHKGPNQNGEEAREVKVFDKWEMLEAAELPSAEIYQLYGKNGLPNDWDVMRLQWEYMFKRLGISFEDYPVCVVLPTELNNVNHKKVTDTLLGYGIPMVQLLSEPVCNTLSHGRSSGIVVDIGHSGVKVDVVIDGVLLRQYHKENNFGGAFLNWQICDQYLHRDSNSSVEIWRDATEWLPVFKNSMLQVSPIELDANHEVASHYQHMVLPLAASKHFLLNKKTTTFTNKDLYSISELLFKPVVDQQDSTANNTATVENAAAAATSTATKPPADKLVGIIGLIRACVQNVLSAASSMASSTGSGLININTSATVQGSDATLSTHNYTSEQLQSLLLTNILVTGRTSNIQGLEQRLLNDVSVSLNDLTTVRPKILFKQTKIDKHFQSWQSATTLCRLPKHESLHPWETSQDSRQARDTN